MLNPFSHLQSRLLSLRPGSLSCLIVLICCKFFVGTSSDLAQLSDLFVGRAWCCKMPQTCSLPGRRHCGRVPLPRWRWTACMHLGPRRRRRKRELSTRHLATQLIIACLNWEVLGHPVDPPPEGCLGYPISDAQHLIIEHIESLVDHHLSSGDFTEDDLGRFLEKYQGVIKMLEELPHCHSSGEDLTSVLIDLQADLDPYNSHFGGRVHHRTEDKPKSDHQCTFDRSAPLPMSGARPVISSRIKWQFPPSFEAEAYLTNPLVKAAFEDPEVMRKPKEFWSPSKPAKINW